ncbi:FAD:protein FMN transferase [Nocardiopsis metallicus]|uniref:FAD:protein FMN transferase n=1 Tax=Nocardiopsis metallicus TaxID=179819 RepID=A0A840WH83_9ACTN|nr:FAD:protein FMN transferase [Nocardiopsis metallicus]MBB5489428.1 thiamine biosynthesis lipoprotein [Nocardiopsis metallicus]
MQPLAARPHGWDLTAIGTHWRIDTPEPPAPELTAAVAALVADFDRAYSRFRPDSLVTRLAETGGPVTFPDSVVGLLDLYETLFHATGGAVSPLVGASLARLGDDADHTLRQQGEPLPAPALERLRREGTTLAIEAAEPAAVAEPAEAADVVLDFGAAGKGWLVDEVTALLAERGVTGAVVDASGDLRVHGAPLRVALEHPWDPAQAIGIVEVRDRALAASATNRRRWGEGLHHVLDARTGEPVERTTATWVLAGTAAVADGVATALFHTEPEELAARTGVRFGYVRVFTDGTLQHAPGPPVTEPDTPEHPTPTWEIFR